MGKENYEHCNYKIKYFVEFDNTTHGISYLYNTEKYRESLKNFIEEVGIFKAE